ncbi:unnamed protein product [Ceutorhynchus assimilis]|uniref:Protein asunder n=1 Tax=Ceutorhynchus assimilis TaxID=467358 RepID=A0A9P0DJT7_9CUCU|nr:unnamed protein product [Ceutorhynchus assimilis]
MYPTNHKTLFVLDHTPYFGISCESPIEFGFLKGRTDFIPPISKSLWTLGIESAVEYSRMVWDLFPTGKLIRFFASDNLVHILNTWSSAQQSISHIMNGCAVVGAPPSSSSISPSPDYTVLHGLRAAIEGMCEPTEFQIEKIKTGRGKLLNKCRVICITSARDNKSMKRLEEIFLTVLNQQNKVVSGNDTLLRISHCHLIIINTFPINNMESSVNGHPAKRLSAILTTEVHSIKAPQIPNKLTSLILEHYDLASTTVTCIPMKEDPNASSSAYYDVEMFHSSTAHVPILKGNPLDSAAIRAIKEGLEYETVILKWCTPRRVTGNELHNCIAMNRITPVAVNSRPSLCLIKFLLNGHSVMLEMPRKGDDKIATHFLEAHGGEIFIHSLHSVRSVLEDPPSILEGCGGRVTDYRIQDFGLLIRQNTLVTITNKNSQEKPLENVVGRLNRQTKYWPLTISSTLIFNLKQAMWSELERFLKSNLYSENHKVVYRCLMECLNNLNLDEDASSEKLDFTEALNQQENVGANKYENAQGASVIRATTDSPMSPPPLANIPESSSQNSYAGKTLYEIFDIIEIEKVKIYIFYNVLARRKIGSICIFFLLQGHRTLRNVFNTKSGCKLLACVYFI